MIEEKRFSGVMNLDDSDGLIPQGQHKYALNGRFYGDQQGYRFENVMGNVLVDNSDLPNGTNQCIGSFYDSVRQRIIWFNYNNYGHNGIYQYSTKTQTVQKLLLCNTDSTTDILGFSPDYPIASVNILYRTESEGDILHWCARNNNPMKLNLKEAIDGTYGTNWLVDYLYVNRFMPLISPSCQYKNDSSVLVNNLRKTLYEFRYRYVYRDFTKSTWSPYSKLFSPLNPDDLATDTDATKNNRIDVIVYTGGADCTDIEISMRLCNGSTFSDCYLVDVLNKAELSISDNGQYTYQFFNNSSYPQLDVNESNLLFSYVPNVSNTQELLNGNVIIYGGMEEGRDFNVTIDVDSDITTFENTGSNPITILAYGVGRNWIYQFIDQPNAGDVIYLRFILDFYNGDPQVDYEFSYVVMGGDTSTTVRDAFVTQINASPALVNATSYSDSNGTNGIKITGDDAFNVVSYAGSGPSTSYEIVYSGSVPTTDDVNIAAYKHKAQYRFGLVYFDDFGVTNGVQTSDDLLVTMPELDTTGGVQMEIPNIEFTINHQPPLGAKYFSWVRALNLTFATHIPFVSSKTKKDTDFGYVGITNLQTNENQFGKYSFTSGDRIRIVGQFVDSAAGTVSVLDVPVVDYVTDPTINGVPESGNYIKVPYDSTTMSNWGTSPYYNYYCEVYTPAINTDADKQIFFEIGETYQILYPGTADRAHQGKRQDQIAGVQGAIYDFSRGDVYVRKRQFPVSDDLQTVDTVWGLFVSVSDLYPSTIVGTGRPFVIDKYAEDKYYMTRVRWGGKYQQETNINQTNLFYPASVDEVDRSKGDIQRFKARERILRVFQNRGCAQYGVYARFIQNNQGQSELVTTNDIITVNNIQYYQGNFGIGTQYTSLVSANIQDYFIDPVTGNHIRLSSDGITNLSENYKGQFYLKNLLVNYNKTWVRSNGSTAWILGAYNYFDEECIVSLQGGVNGDDTIADYTFSFNERRNGYSSFFSYFPDWLMSAEETIYSWKDGYFFVHNSETRCNFYGIQYDCEVQFPVNNNLIQRKTWLSLKEVSSDIWDAPLIYTNVNTYGTQRQETNLNASEFTVIEGNPASAIKRDSYSRGGKNNGDTMKGNFIVIKLRKQNAANLVFLDSVTVKSIDSPQNP